jgi:hypothetical protein
VALLKQRSTSQLPLGQTTSACLPLASYRTLQTNMFALTVKATKNSSVEHVVVMAVRVLTICHVHAFVAFGRRV